MTTINGTYAWTGTSVTLPSSQPCHNGIHKTAVAICDFSYGSKKTCRITSGNFCDGYVLSIMVDTGCVVMEILT